MRRVIAVLAVLAVVLLPACAQQPEEEQAQKPGHLLVAAAAGKTQDAGSAKMAMEMKMTGGQQDMTITAEGAFEFTGQQRGFMKMDLGEMAAQSGMGEMELILDGTTIYMKMPNAAQMGVTTPWVKMDAKTMAGGQGLGQPGLGSSDPSQTMEMLRGVSDDVEEIGTEDIRGTSATHYKATLDLNKAVADAPAKTRKEMRQQLKILGTKTLPVDVWVDAEGLLRRMEMTVDMSKADMGGAPAGAVPTSMFMRMDLYDFGTDVNVKIPKAKDVTDFAKLQGRAGG